MFASCALAAALYSAPDSAAEHLQVQVDSSHHLVVVTTSPFDLPDMSGMHDHSKSHDTPVYRFTWPIDGWFRGFRVSVLDENGGQLSRRLIHHMIMINYNRRQLIYSAAERLWGAGVETGSVSLPATIGVPLAGGTPLGLYIAWHNTTGQDVAGARLRLTMEWVPSNQLPRPVDVLPLYFDVNLRVGGANEFDVPPGPSERSFEFSVPVEGRILALGGHMHDYGREVRLEDAATGKVLTRVRARVDSGGRLRSMERHLFGVRGEGLRLRPDHRYRVVAVYDNPTADTLTKAAKGSLAGIFAPRDMAAWPLIQPDDSLYQSDLRFLARRGAQGMNPRPAPATADSSAGGPPAHHHR